MLTKGEIIALSVSGGVVLIVVIILAIVFSKKNSDNEIPPPPSNGTIHNSKLWPGTSQVLTVEDSRDVTFAVAPNPNRRTIPIVDGNTITVKQDEPITQDLFTPIDNKTRSGALFTSGTGKWIYVTMEVTGEDLVDVIVSDGTTSPERKTTFTSTVVASDISTSTTSGVLSTLITIASTDVFFIVKDIVGSAHYRLLFFKRSGTTWIMEDIGNLFRFTGHISVIEDDENIVLMSGNFNPQIYFYNGTSWTNYAVPFIPGEDTSKINQLFFSSGTPTLVCQVGTTSELVSMFLYDFPTNHTEWTLGSYLNVNLDLSGNSAAGAMALHEDRIAICVTQIFPITTSRMFVVYTNDISTVQSETIFEILGTESVPVNMSIVENSVITTFGSNDSSGESVMAGYFINDFNDIATSQVVTPLVNSTTDYGVVVSCAASEDGTIGIAYATFDGTSSDGIYLNTENILDVTWKVIV